MKNHRGLAPRKVKTRDDYSINVREGDYFNEKSCGTNAIFLAKK